jgi:hypothetical protein
MDDLFDNIDKSSNQSYCFGLNFIENEVNYENNTFDLSVEFSFNAGMIPNTNTPPYDPNIMSPDIGSWGEYGHTAAAVYPYISEFIGRYIQVINKNETGIMSQQNTLFKQTVAYAPMTT